LLTRCLRGQPSESAGCAKEDFECSRESPTYRPASTARKPLDLVEAEIQTFTYDELEDAVVWASGAKR
jgi:hypothetical protein